MRQASDFNAKWSPISVRYGEPSRSSQVIQILAGRLLSHLRMFGLVVLSSIISAALFIVAFEIIENIRYAYWKAHFNIGWPKGITAPSSNPALMWEYRPYGDSGGIKTNRYGFREFDYQSREKPCNTFRVAFVGDSITLGLGVSEEETFVRQFEVFANKANPGNATEALNFGIDGYNTLQVYEVTQHKVLPFSPDDVVYVMCLNDFDFFASSGEKILYFQKPQSFFLYRIDHLRWILSGEDYHLYHFRKKKNEVYQKILAMKEMLEHNGLIFQVVIVPIFPQDTASFDNYPLQQMHEEIKNYLRKHNIPFLDLLKPFSLPGEAPRNYSLDIWHPNAAGHQFIAQQLLTFVLSEQAHLRNSGGLAQCESLRAAR